MSWLEDAKKEFKRPGEPWLLDAVNELHGQEGQRLKSSIDYGVKQNPEKFAKVQQSSQQLGIPQTLAERNSDNILQIANKEDIQRQLQDTEFLKKIFEKPEFSSIAHDDVGPLSKLEHTVKALGAGASQAVLGMAESVWRTPESIQRFIEAGNELLGVPKLSKYLKEKGAPSWVYGLKTPGLHQITQGFDIGDIHQYGTSDVANMISKSQEILGTEFSTFTRLNQKGRLVDVAFTKALNGDFAPFMDIISDPEAWTGFVGQALPSFLTAYKSGGSIPFIAWMESMETANDISDFERRTGTTVDPVLYTQAMAQVAVVNSYLEKLGLGKVFGQGGRSTIAGFITGALSEGGTEALQQFNQNVSAYITYDPNQKLSEGVLGSAMGGFGVGGPGGALAAAGLASGPNSEFARNIVKAQKSIDDQTRLDTAVKAVQETKTRQRNPQAVKEFIDNILGAENEIYIPIDDAQAFFQSHPEIMSKLPQDVAESINESMITGSDVAVTKSDYLTYLSDFHEELSESVRNDMDGMTAKEAKEWVKEGTEQFQKEADKILEEMNSSQMVQESADRVAQNIKEQIVQTGRFTEDIAEKYSQLHRAFAITMADKLDITPEEVYQRFGLQVTAAPTAEEALSQPFYCNVCDKLRRTPEGEAKWQHMMETKQEITETEFLSKVDINELPILDEGETWEDYREYAGEDLKFFESDKEYFFQVAGFEFIWDKDTGEVLYQDSLKKIPKRPETEEEIDQYLAEARERHMVEEARFKERMRAIETGEILYQDLTPEEKVAIKKRGQIVFQEDSALINLLQNADLSTFIHESGHFFFEAYKNFAVDSPEIAQDMQVLLDHIGIKDLGTWNGMTLEQRREGHEKIARSFEAYLFEGKAPNLEIQSIFQRFRDWLIDVYKNLSNLNVNLTKEVRAVFDRMLATKEQIRQKEVAQAYYPLFESAEEAGMTEKQWAEYQNANELQKIRAETELQTKSLKDMQWLSNAKSRLLKKIQSENKSKRRAMKNEVTADVEKEPVYLAINFVRKGIGPNGEKVDLHKLDVDRVNELSDKKPRGMTQKNGTEPDIIAELFGFSSGSELIQKINDAQPLRERIEDLTDRRMLQTYGDLNSPETIDRAIEGALHNEAHTRFLHTELSSLSKRTGTRNILSRAAKNYAENSINRKKIKDIRPFQYSSAEVRAAKNAERALVKGDRNSAAEHKRAQVLNNHFFRAASNAREEVDKTLRYFKKFSNESTRKNLDPDYRDQIDSLLERYDLKKSVSLKEIEKRKSLNEWVKSQEEQGLTPAIDDTLLNEARKQHYKDTTLEEFRGLRDSVKNIEHLARLKTKLLKAKKAREIDEIATEVSDSVRKYSTGKHKAKIEHNSWLDRARKGKNEFFAMHRKFASLARQMDGDREGPMWEYFIRTMNESGNFEAVQREQATIKLNEIFKPLLKEKIREKIFIPEINTSLTREGRISVALNWGNETNRKRVMDGDGWTPSQVNAILNTLSNEEWDFVQNVWDFIDTYWEQIAAKEKRVTGIIPGKVDPSPVMTQYGEYRGGYYPIKFDPERSTRSEQDSLAEITRQAMNGLYTRATTRRGHTKARVREVNRPIRKDFGVIFEHVDQVVHDLSWHEWLIDTNRLLRNSKIDTSIRETYGPEILNTIRRAVDDIAAGELPAQNQFERSINYLRHGASIAGMGWNIWTSLLQPLGLTQSMVRVGPKWIGKGMAEWLGGAVKMENTVKNIYEKSDFMRLRGKTLQREINEIRNRIAKNGKLPVVTDSYFYLIAKAQMVADVPTWLGAYEKAVYEGNNEDRAVAIADQAVLDAQGGGQIKDLAQIQRGSPLLKLWTNFYSYFNTTFNLTAESYRRTSFKDPAKVARFAVDMMLLYIVPATISALMREVFNDRCHGDEECIVENVVRENLSYMSGTMVGTREMTGFLSGFYGYEGPAGTRFFSEVSKLGKQIEQGEVDAALWKSLNNTGGILFHYPSGQVDRTVRGLMAIEEGEVEGGRVVTAPIIGPPK